MDVDITLKVDGTEQRLTVDTRNDAAGHAERTAEDNQPEKRL